MALLCFVLQGSLSFAQIDSTVKAHINELISKEPALHLRADSVSKTAAGLQVWFNTDSAFAQGALSETESEGLTELLLHLLEDTGSPELLLLAKDKSTGEYRSLDHFVHAPAIEPYRPIPNNDPYPDLPGSNRMAMARVFPGSGQPVGTGALAGKTVWLSPGHGWQNTGTGLGFLTQRGTSNTSDCGAGCSTFTGMFRALIVVCITANRIFRVAAWRVEIERCDIARRDTRGEQR